MAWRLGFQAFTAMAQVQPLIRELKRYKPHGKKKICYFYTEDFGIRTWPVVQKIPVFRATGGSRRTW